MFHSHDSSFRFTSVWGIDLNSTPKYCQDRHTLNNLICLNSYFIHSFYLPIPFYLDCWNIHYFNLSVPWYVCSVFQDRLTNSICLFYHVELGICSLICLSFVQTSLTNHTNSICLSLENSMINCLTNLFCISNYFVCKSTYVLHL